MSDAPGNQAEPRPQRQRKNDGRGGFFAVDRRMWPKVCALGVNPAIAYLVIACGTGGDQVSSSWSAQAVSKYTSIVWKRADQAIDLLVARGLIQRDAADKARARPHYKIVLGGQAAPPGRLEPVLQAMASGRWIIPPARTRDVALWGSSTPRQDGEELVSLGYATRTHNGQYRPAASSAGERKSNWIWLPNALVTGAASETPPVEMLRQTGDARLIQMLINLYAQHDLADDGGINFRTIRSAYERTKLGQSREFSVWGFSALGKEVFQHKAEFAHHYRISEPSTGEERTEIFRQFWASWNMLVGTGLVQEVAHLVNADTEEGEIIHPLPLEATDIPIEHELTLAAEAAARGLLREGQRALDFGSSAMAPAHHHLTQIALVGIYRLRYRPRTDVTLAFMAKEERWRVHLADLEALNPDRSTSRGHQGGVKDASRGHQR